MAGAVHWNGRPVRIASKLLSAGAAIDAYIDVEKLFQDSTSRDTKFKLTSFRILFEDDDLIAVDKPSGLPSHPTVDEARDNLFAAVSSFLFQRDGVAKPYLGVHQRLDRDTSGVVLFTKSQRVNAAVAEVFFTHRAMKVYQALTSPPLNSQSGTKLEREWTVRNYLGKVSSKAKRAKYGAVGPAGDLAETSFRVLAHYPRGLWIQAMPRTGRTHQIRVHLSEYGLPILGDDLYGRDERRSPPTTLAPRLMLHAAELTLPHPITGSELRIRSPLPEDFRQCLKRLRAG